MLSYFLVSLSAVSSGNALHVFSSKLHQASVGTCSEADWAGPLNRMKIAGGGNLWGRFTGSVSQCKEKCCEEPTCKGFSYSEYEGGVCYGTDLPEGGKLEPRDVYDAYFYARPTPEPPTTAPTCEDGSTGNCTVSEDPHIKVFDGRQMSLLASNTTTRATSAIDEESGDMWLVKSDRVSIQARYLADNQASEGNLFVRAIAVGGTFLRGNTIVVGALEDQVTYNDVEILSDPTASEFKIFEGPEFFVNATRGESSSLVQDLSKQNAGVNIELPLGVKLIVNRLRSHVNLAVKMPPQKDQEGLCGNFNGIAADDAVELAKERFDPKVQPQDSLFTGTNLD